MREKLEFHRSYYLLFPFMAAAFIPWVKWHIQFRYLIPIMLIWVISAFTERRKIRIPRKGGASLTYVFILLGLYYGLGLLFLPFGHGDGITYTEFVDFVVTAFLLLVFHLSISNGRLYELKVIIIFCFICLSISALMTILGERIIEGGSRALAGAGGRYADDNLVAAAVDAGIGGYSQVYGLGLLAFPLLYCTKFMPLRMKVIATFLVVLLLMTVYFGGYTICIIGISFSGVFYLIMKSGINIKLTKICSLVILTLFVTAVANPKILSAVLSPIESLSELTKKQAYQERLGSISDVIAGKDNTYAENRCSLYWMSWDTFLKHPFFGIGKYDFLGFNPQMDQIGQHSLIFDLLGCGGLFGASIFILFFIFYFRYMQVMSSIVLGHEWWPAYYIFIFSAAGVGFVNPLRSYWILSDIILFIPSLALFFKGTELNSKNSRLPVLPLVDRNSAIIKL